MMFVFMFGNVCTMLLGERGHQKLCQSLQQLQKGNSEKRKGQWKSFLSGLLCFIVRNESGSGVSLTSP